MARLKTVNCLVVILLLTITHQCDAQTTVNIDDGQSFVETDLSAGIFDGVPFTLGPSTTFEINNGGRIGTDTLNTPRSNFDFDDSNVVVNSGGALGSLFSGSTISEVALTIQEGGHVVRSVELSDSTVEMLGGSIENFFKVNTGSTVNVSGGQTEDIEISDTDINISGGSVGSIDAITGSSVSVSGGEIGGVRVNNNSTLDTTNGILGGVVAFPTSVVNMSGGKIIFSFNASHQSTANFTGGSINATFLTNPASTVNISGGEFLLNGLPHTNSTITLADSDVFSGTLTDGSNFVFSTANFLPGSDVIEGVNLITTSLPPINTSPQVVNTSSGPSPYGLRTGQSLTVETGGELAANFAVVEASLTVNGGTVGGGLEVVDGQVEVSDGLVGGNARIYNGSVVIISGGEIGGFFTAYDGSTINKSGGAISGRTNANSGSTFNISGGSIDELEANLGSTINISGGNIDGRIRGFGGDINIDGGNINNRFSANAGTVSISGGSIAPGFGLASASTGHISGGSFGHNAKFVSDGSVTFYGGEFQLNGVPFSGSTIGPSLSLSDVFTGTFADGSTFVFSRLTGDSFIVNQLSTGINLVPSSLPPLDTTPVVINASSGSGPQGLRSGQSLTLEDGGVLNRYFAVIEANLTVNGGQVGDGLEVYNADVNISGGVIGNHVDIHAMSTINVAGGKIGSDMTVHPGSTLNLSGGDIGDSLFLDSGSTLIMSGGNLGDGFTARTGSTVTITGGSIGRDFEASADTVEISGGRIGTGFENDPSGTTTFLGGEFRLNGVPYTSSTITLGNSDVFTGVFNDGSSFIFSSFTDELEDVHLVSSSFPAPDPIPVTIDGSSASVPKGLRPGQTLILEPGGVLPDAFAVVGGMLNINGGEVGAGLEIVDTEMNIFGGILGGDFTVHANSTVNVYGGEIDRDLTVLPGGTLNLFVRSISLGGNAQDLSPGVPLVIDSPGSLNSIIATLSDGSTIVLASPSIGTYGSVFATGSTLRVTLVPEPCSLVLSAVAFLGLLRSRRFPTRE